MPYCHTLDISILGILRGLKEGLIDIDSIDVEEAWSCVLLAWEGLALKINEDGTIRDIIGGTGIQVIFL